MKFTEYEIEPFDMEKLNMPREMRVNFYILNYLKTLD